MYRASIMTTMLELVQSTFGSCVKDIRTSSSFGSLPWLVIVSQNPSARTHFAVIIHSNQILISSFVPVHWVDLDRVVEHDRATATLFGTNRIRYMSASRSRHLYKLQKRIMEDLTVPFIDLFEATYLSADQLYPSDGRHYRPDLNRKMIGWFYSQHATESVLLEMQTPKYYPQVSI